jgi:UDP-N-acetylglucosamine 3-dehydrogenase
MSQQEEARSLRAAVIGTGAMGRNHVRIYGDLPGVDLVGVVDADQVQMQRAIGKSSVRGYISVEQLLRHETVDLASVAVPTQLHHAVTSALLAAGVAVLVEKPFAFTVEEGLDLLERAERAGRPLMVGHIERFNPAVIELKRRLDAGELGHVFQIHATRVGPFPSRIRDVGVVIDLATHDLDLMRYLLNQEAVRVYAETGRNIHTAHEDMLSGVIKFSQGTVGVLDINWLTPTKQRTLSVTGEKGMFLANYLTQDLTFYENKAYPVEWDQLRALTGVAEGSSIRFALYKEEPLRAEIAAFVASVRNDTPVPVSGAEGLAALRLAEAIVEAGRCNTVVALTPGE